MSLDMFATRTLFGDTAKALLSKEPRTRARVCVLCMLVRARVCVFVRVCTFVCVCSCELVGGSTRDGDILVSVAVEKGQRSLDLFQIL